MKQRIADRIRAAEKSAGAVWTRILRNLTVTGIGLLFSTVLNFGRTVILIRALPIEDYGRVIISLNVIIFLTSFLSVRAGDLLYSFFPGIKQDNNPLAARTFLALCLGICLCIGTVSGLLLFFLSPWISVNLYHDPSLSILLRLLAILALLVSLNEFAVAILRLSDRFSWIIIPQAFGSLVTLGLLVLLLLTRGKLTPELAVISIGAGMALQILPGLAAAIGQVSTYWKAPGRFFYWPALEDRRKRILSTLVQTNAAASLKLIYSPGDVFILGVFSNPIQAAFYGLAQQITRPVVMLQSNAQTVFTPEIVTLWGKKDFPALRKLTRQLILSGLAAAVLLIVFTVPLARPAVILLAGPVYAPSAVVVILMMALAALRLIVHSSYPLGLAMGELHRHNLSSLLNLLPMILLIVSGNVSAMGLSLLQLFAAAVTFLIFGRHVFHNLFRAVPAEKESTHAENPSLLSEDC